MKKPILFVALLLNLFILSADARQGGPFGLGVVLGDPTGLSMKYWTSRENAVSAALAFGTFHHHYDNYYYNDETDVYLHVNYLWHNFGLLPVQRGQLPVYWGAGGRLYFGHDFALGVRGCGGLEYLPVAPIDIFLELGLVIDFMGNHPGADGDLGIGIRYFF